MMKRVASILALALLVQACALREWLVCPTGYFVTLDKEGSPVCVPRPCVGGPCPSPSPSASPSPAPTPSPTAQPTPLPTPTPAPTPAPDVDPCPGWTPLATSCGGPESPEGSGLFGCCDSNVKSEEFANVVVRSYTAVLQKHPSWVSGKRLVAIDGDMTAAINRYRSAVSAEVRREGYCSLPAGSFDEIAVSVPGSALDRMYDLVVGTPAEFVDHEHGSSTCRAPRPR